MQHFKLVIAGKAAEGGRYADVLNPSTGEIVAQMPVATASDVELASFPAWAAKTSVERAQAVRPFTIGRGHPVAPRQVKSL